MGANVELKAASVDAIRGIAEGDQLASAGQLDWIEECLIPRHASYRRRVAGGIRPVLSRRKKCEGQHDQPSHDDQRHQGSSGYSGLLFGGVFSHFSASVVCFPIVSQVETRATCPMGQCKEK